MHFPIITPVNMQFNMLMDSWENVDFSKKLEDGLKKLAKKLLVELKKSLVHQNDFWNML